MDIITLAVKAVFPILALMAIGYGCRRGGLLTEELIRKVNRVVFMVFLPTLIFVNLYSTDFLDILNWKIIGFIAMSTTVVFVLGFIIVPLLEKNNPRRGVIVQGMFRGNGVYIGLPVMIALTGRSHVGLMALALAVIVILYNIYSVIVLETFRHSKINIGAMLRNIIKNPMIIGALAGIAAVVSGLKIPSVCMTVLDDIGGCATPLALIMLGGSFVFTAAGQYKKQLFATVFVKLILAPAIFLPIAILLQFSVYEFAVVFSILCAPTAVATFTVAQQMGGDGKLAGQIVVWSSVCSIVTIFIWIIIMQQYVVA